MKRGYATFAAIAMALLAGCTPKKEPNVAAGPNLAVTNQAETAPTVADSAIAREKIPGSLPVLGPAPAWKLRDVSGNEVRSDQFKGKVVVLDFWATWCGPCREEIPGYVDLYRKYGKDRLVIVGASVDEGGAGVVKAFAEKYGVNYPVVMADDQVQSAYGGMDAIPTTFLIDQNGQIRDKKVGTEDTAEYEKKIKSLLN